MEALSKGIIVLESAYLQASRSRKTKDAKEGRNHKELFMQSDSEGNSSAGLELANQPSVHIQYKYLKLSRLSSSVYWSTPVIDLINCMIVRRTSHFLSVFSRAGQMSSERFTSPQDHIVSAQSSDLTTPYRLENDIVNSSKNKHEVTLARCLTSSHDRAILDGHIFRQWLVGLVIME